MRRISAFITSLVTSFALALSGLVFSPAQASAPADGTYACGDGTYTITTVNSVITFGDARTCTGPLVIPEGVEATAFYTFGFYGDAKVTSVSLPESLSQIGFSAFYGTGLLTEINVASTNVAFTSVGGVLFRLNGASASLFAYPSKNVESTYTTPTSVSFAGGSPIPVTRIEGYALQGAKALTTLNISEGVTTLGYGIAESATLLSAINLPDSYTAMTEMSFAGASALTALTIGASVTSIGLGEFRQTGNLNSITVDALNPNYSSLDGVLFDKDRLILHTYPSGNTGSYDVPVGVTTIESKAFYESKLTSVSIPEGVTHIGSNAFYQSKVTSISLPDSLIEIASEAFQYSELATVNIPKNLLTLGNNAFDQAFKLTSITVDALNPNYSSLDGVLFNDDFTVLIAYPVGNPVASYTIPSGVGTVDKKSFQAASKLTSVIFPSSISAIESEAFSCASYLTSFIFRGDAPTVADYAFSCISDPKAYIKSGNTTFTLDANGKWNGLTVSEFDHFVNFDSKGGSAVSLSAFLTGGSVSAPTAPTRDFYGFTGWSTTNSVADGGTAVTFPYTPSGDITLFANWFKDGNYLCSTGVWTEDSTDTYLVTGGVVSNGGACTGDVVIPEGVTHLGTSAFASSSMTSISLPESLIEIGTQAFLGTGLTTMTIPNNVSTLGVGVFQAATALTSITVAANNGSFTSSSDGVLFNESLTTLIAYPLGKTAASYTIPTGVTTIGDRAFMSSQLATVIISPDVEIMEGLAFFCSTRLNSYVFLGDAPVVVSSSVGCGGAAGPNAFIKSGNTSFALDADGKWNGLAVKTLAPTGSYSCATGVLTTATTDIYSITDGVVSAGSACADDVVISAGVRSIEHHAFSAAQSITSVTFAGDGMLTDIGEYAFEWLTGLASIEIPASVSTIGYAAFFGNTALASIFFLGDDPAIDGDIFLTSQYPEMVLVKPTKAYFRDGASGFTSVDGKWNGVPISPFYTLTFDATGSLSGLAPSQIISGGGENVTMPGNSGGLTKAGYTFASWNSESDGNGDSFAVGDVGPMPAFDEIFYAKWTANTYVTTYSYNSATGGKTVVSSSFTTGGTSIRLPTPTRTGYTFGGWYSNSGLTTKIGNAGANYSPTGTNLALNAFAKWTKNVKAAATVKPTVSGTAKVGKTLTAKNGTWTGSPTPSFTYQWYSCSAEVKSAASTISSKCKSIAGATKSTFKLASAQRGKWVTVLVTGTSSGTTKTIWLAKSAGKVG